MFNVHLGFNLDLITPGLSDNEGRLAFSIRNRATSGKEEERDRKQDDEFSRVKYILLYKRKTR